MKKKKSLKNYLPLTFWSFFLLFLIDNYVYTHICRCVFLNNFQIIITNYSHHAARYIPRTRVFYN